jgi:hypothetical protein
MIGGHAQVNVGLSGAFSFFIVRESAIQFSRQTSNFQGRTLNARIEGAMTDVQHSRLLEILNQALSDYGSNLLFKFRKHTTKKLLITFNKRSFPNSHSDSKSNKGKVNDCRILWDFHPRGRILSVYTKEYGLFLENCGIEFCSREMCGRVEYPGAVGNLTERKLQHQGWDCRNRASGCALVTALLDLEIVGNGSTDAFVPEVITAINSKKFRSAISNGMNSYVKEKMNYWKTLQPNLTEEELRNSQVSQNEYLMGEWCRIFEGAQPPNGQTIDLYSDVSTNDYLQSLK